MTMANIRIRIRPGGTLGGVVRVPGDKSISHRALILGALADGLSHIRSFLPAGDTLATLRCLRGLGVQVERHNETTLTVHGRGLRGLGQPTTPLNCVNAGTALRLMAGVLAGQSFSSVLDGSEQLRQRPMDRITRPLRLMGAQIEDEDGYAPLHITGNPLHGTTYEMPVASAQVKSCLLLAGLFADDATSVIEPGPARDHTERMLRDMGANLQVNGTRITLTPVEALRPLDIIIPGDISSAAFLLVAAALIPGTEIHLENVGVNPTRTGLLDILAQMGAQVQQLPAQNQGGEPAADLTVRHTALRGATVAGDLVVRAIDEFPALMVAATQANGDTIVSGAAELRVKETDRIAVLAGELRKLGATIDEQADGFRITGPQQLRGAVVNGHDDHRVAMSLAIAGLLADGETVIDNARCVEDSFPGFVETFQALGADIAHVA